MGVPQADVVQPQTTASSSSSLPTISQKDMKDPALWLLNHILHDFIWNKIVSLYGGAGTINLTNTLTAPDVQIPTQTQPPTNGSSVLTLDSALALFDPANQRISLGSGVFNTSTNSAQTVQPLPNTGVGTAGGWTMPTGTELRSGFDTGSATTTELAETLKALIDDLFTIGILR